ncbi:hypothetical protein S1OALGB6SA_662 [Olavius algarvensis spirochete endosymbiont]|nr:hypothetical protein [Olavius algarvensis spirochete endosymbiont]CAD7842604.1 MAG: hypothetical protein [Olavius algarvensis spirochete endosymbiont]VDA99591.1 hypothetical protein S1OALGB6SA_662 [Olavius algarvensis spirochete endosymbiont]
MKDAVVFLFRNESAIHLDNLLQAINTIFALKNSLMAANTA